MACGSAVCSIGRLLRRLTRRQRVSKSARSQIEWACSLIAARVSSFINAPPPVATTFRGPSSNLKMTRRSPSRKACSPWCSNISGMLQPAADSISSSASTNSISKLAERRRPIALLPAPIIPTRTKGFSKSGIFRADIEVAPDTSGKSLNSVVKASKLTHNCHSRGLA